MPGQVRSCHARSGQVVCILIDPDGQKRRPCVYVDVVLHQAKGSSRCQLVVLAGDEGLRKKHGDAYGGGAFASAPSGVAGKPPRLVFHATGIALVAADPESA